MHPIAAVQVEYSPFTTEIESSQTHLLATCRDLGVVVVAYSPLSRGLLSGQIKNAADFEPTDVRRHYPRFSAENFPKNMLVVNELKRIADKKGCTAAQLTLAWLLSQGDDVFPIPGTTKIHSLEENCAAALIELTQDEVDSIRKLVTEASCHGARYSPEHALGLFADTPLPGDQAGGKAASDGKTVLGGLYEK